MTQPTSNLIAEDRLRNTRAWAMARIGQMSGADVIVGAIDELLERRAADETAGYRIIRGKGGKGWAYVRGDEYPHEGFETFEAADEAARAQVKATAFPEDQGNSKLGFDLKR